MFSDATGRYAVSGLGNGAYTISASGSTTCQSSPVNLATLTSSVTIDLGMTGTGCASLVFVPGPAGANGANGDTGPTGPQGPAGPPAGEPPPLGVVGVLTMDDVGTMPIRAFSQRLYQDMGRPSASPILLVRDQDTSSPILNFLMASGNWVDTADIVLAEGRLTIELEGIYFEQASPDSGGARVTKGWDIGGNKPWD